MKKIAVITLLGITLLNTFPSHAMSLGDFNPETRSFHSLAHTVANKTGDVAYMDRLGENDPTPLQEFVTLSAPEETSPTVWIFINSFLKQMLRWDQSVNRANPKTGNTALGDLIIHCHPTNNYIHHMAEHLISAGARLDNIDSLGNSLCDLLEQARESGALTLDQYSDIAAKPSVKQHIAQRAAARAAYISGALDEFLPLALHRPITQYECGMPQ